MKTTVQAQTSKRSIDWDALRAKVAQMGARLLEEDDQDPEEMAELLKQRAKQLAQAPQQEDTGQRIDLLMVRIGREIYGLEVKYVHDIRLLQHITRVPRTPEWLGGVVNVRGRILAGINMQQLFGLWSGDNPTGPQYLVLIETPVTEAALIVQEVLAVESYLLSQIQDSNGTVRGIHPEYVRGVVANHTPEGGALLVVLDLAAIVSDPLLIVQEEMI